MMVGNATLLSVVYLSLGLALEVMSRWIHVEWAGTMTRALDSLPIGALHRLHLLEWVQMAYDRDYLNRFELRLVLGLTTVAIIFATAVLVGAGMWAVRAWVE